MNAQPQAFAVNPAPTEPANPTLRDLFPAFRIYSADELRAMSAEQLAAALSDAQKLKDTVHTESVRLEAQISALEAQIQTACDAIKAEFGVDTVEQLDALITQTRDHLAVQYTALTTLSLSAPTVQ